MKIKISKFKIFIFIILAILSVLVYKVYKFNKLSSEVEVFNTKIDKTAEFIGVVDDKYYRLEKGYFIGSDEQKELFRIKVLNIKNIIYDKFIYLIEGYGRIKLLDRNTGDEIKSYENIKDIQFAELKNSKIVVYTKNSIYLGDLKLNKFDEINDLLNPIKIDFNKNIKSIIEFNQDFGNIKSILIVKNSENQDFVLSSQNEIFIFTKIIGDKVIAVSNKYIYSIKDNSIENKIFLKKINSIDANDENLVIADNGELFIYDKDLKLLDKKVLNNQVENISIRKNSIVILSNNKIKLYQNSNIIENDIPEYISYYVNSNDYYIVFPNRIEKLKAY